MALYCALFAALPKLWAKTEKAEIIGTVLQIQGTWRITEESPALLAGQGIPAGALIKTASANKTDFLVIVLLNGQRLAATCKAEPCAITLQAPANYTDTGITFQRMIEAVKYVLLNRRPEVVNAFSSISSRGRNSARSEMVVPFQSDKAVLLASTLSAIPQGDYTLELIRASDAKLLSDRSLHWDLSLEQAAINVPEPGAYVVLLKDTYENIVSNIFLSAVPPASYDRVKSSFEQAQQMCAKWDGVDAAASAHFFLRAYLLALAAKQ